MAEKKKTKKKNTRKKASSKKKTSKEEVVDKTTTSKKVSKGDATKKSPGKEKLKKNEMAKETVGKASQKKKEITKAEIPKEKTEDKKVIKKGSPKGFPSEHIDTKKKPDKKKFSALSSKYVKWIIVGVVSIAVGIIVLNLVGRVFVREIVQEVSFDAEGEMRSAVIGERAPHWEIPNILGKVIQLSDFIEEPVVITFWASWNPLSVDQIKVLDEYLLEEGEGLFNIVAINNQEDRSVAANFVRRGGYQVLVLLDESGAVGESYSVRNLPTTFFLDGEGIVQDVFLGVLNKETLVQRAESIVR